MDLPKNITQIGEADRNCRIYVEDYVISYIRQINHTAENKNVGIALYGVQKEEGGVSYFFLYGACKVDSLQKAVRHLSQAQLQEIEKHRKRFFPEYQFWGYRILNGEMVEGFYVCEQGICREVMGYACFYEKNDKMLAYMLDSRDEDAEPEKVDQEKYDRVRQRQENRRQEYQSQVRQGSRGHDFKKEMEAADRRAKDALETEEENVIPDYKRRGMSAGGTVRTGARARLRDGRNIAEKTGKKQTTHTSGTMQLMRLSVAGTFLLLFVLGIATLNGNGGIAKLQDAAKQMISEFTAQRLPDSEDMVQVINPSVPDNTLFADENLTEAIQKENEGIDNDQKTPDTQEASAAESGTEASEDESKSQTGQAEQTTEAVSSASSPSEETRPEEGQQEGTESSGEGVPETQPSQETENPGETDPTEESEQASAPAPVYYTILRGDTLIGISKKHYGTDAMVKAICELNHITNPDDIYFGQKIILP